MAINFPALESFHFAPNLYDPNVYVCSCGAAACSLLSGVNPYKVKKIYQRLKIPNAHPGHFELSFVLDFLRKYFIVTEVTEHDILPPGTHEVKNNITENHVLLLVQAFSGRENSYSVIWKGKVFHALEIYPLDKLELINRPAKKVFIISNKKKIKCSQ